MTTETNSGHWTVLVNSRSCEGKQTCIDVCPVDVFETRRTEERNPFYWLKIKVHGGLQAFPVNESNCIGCTECVTACPEKAITVEPRPA